MGRIWTISRLTLSEAIRKKIAIVFILMMLFILISLPFVMKGDDTLRGRVQTFLAYSLSSMGFLLSMLTILLACGSVALEIKSKQIQLIGTKPVPRWQLLLGKWLGIVLLDLVLLVIGTAAARHLNVLARGELQAAIVGLPVRGFRYLIFIAAALATALSVTTVGVIGFIGLVVPHLIRIVAGSNHRVVLPASALAGGTLLIIADTLARTIMAPRQLPVGALTAAIGVPLFLILMSRNRSDRDH
ncbi:MAG: iron chelate uptake ABC transporter family permease subunit [Proteobacteria bacterium]|nr:iron chelate uptake ABC transporter family permease subunit [Pseudomonadota bacterium]